MKHPAPYVAATGFTRPSQLAALAADLSSRSSATWPAFSPRYAPRRLVAAVLVSAKTLHGEPTTNRRYPTIDAARRLVEQANALGLVSAVHYNTRANGEDLREELARLVRAVPRLRMLQLNVERPEVEPIRALRDTYPDVEIVLQLNAATRASAKDGNPYLAARPYFVAVDHVLLDLSRGEGRPLDVKGVVHDLNDHQDNFHTAGICVGVAGGLGPDAWAVRDELDDRILYGGFPHLSFDAESNLRVPAPDADPALKYQDDLDVAKVAAWFELFAKDDAR